METYKDHIIETPDVNQERLDTLRKMFPDWFTQEGRLDINEVRKAVNPDDVSETERYEFRWFGKSRAKRNAFTPTRATLHFDPDRSVNAENTDNIIIEGENLEAMKILQQGYRSRIKCMYFDPPYNADALTAYNDDYSQTRRQYWEESGITEEGVIVDTETVPEGRFHSVWLSNIYSRLLIASTLLADDGVIFISINDKEIAHLKKICDEVFYPSNFLAQFIWSTDGNIDNQSKIKTNHEYILMYAKDASQFDYPHVVDPNIPDKSKLNNQEIRNTIVKNGRKNPIQEILIPAGFPCEIKEKHFDAQNTHWPHFLNSVDVRDYKLTSELRVESGWAARGQFVEFMENGFNPVKDTKGQSARFVMTESGNIDCIKDRGFRSHVLTLLQNFGGPQSATSELEALGVEGFDYPKPSQLIQYLVSMINDDDFIVLDIYAGSGTTGHAVLKENIANPGKRKFILIQFPESLPQKHKARKKGFHKISDITIARNKAVCESVTQSYEDKIKTDEDEQMLEHLGFRVYNLSKSSFPRVGFAPDPEKSDEENMELLQNYIREKEVQLSLEFNDDELITEILLKQGFMLTFRLEQQNQFTENTVYLAKDGIREAYITVDGNLSESTVAHFMNHTDKKFICIERALDTTKKYNLKHALDKNFFAF